MADYTPRLAASQPRQPKTESPSPSRFRLGLRRPRRRVAVPGPAAGQDARVPADVPPGAASWPVYGEACVSDVLQAAEAVRRG